MPVRIVDPLREISLGNVVYIWQSAKEEIVRFDQSLSPSRAGEIAAARIVFAYRAAAHAFKTAIEAKDRRGEDISKDEEILYDATDDCRRAIADILISASGIRYWPDYESEPLALRPLDADALPDNLAASEAERQAVLDWAMGSGDRECEEAIVLAERRRKDALAGIEVKQEYDPAYRNRRAVSKNRRKAE